MQKLNLSAGAFLTALFLFPAFCPAQTISIVSGNGQLVCPDCAGAPGKYAPLVVQVNDAAGVPAANTTVTWTATQQGLEPVTSTSQTNAAGQATCVVTIGQPTCAFDPLAFSFGTNFLPATVVASALNASVQFSETTASPNPETGAVPIIVNLIPATSPPVLKGLAGQTSTTSIQVAVTGFLAALPGVSVSLEPWITVKPGSPGYPGYPGGLPWPAGEPTVNCANQPGQQPGTVLTGSTGIATCTPAFGGAVGSGNYTIVVGGNFVNFGSTGFTVSFGPAAIIKTIAGTPQTVNAGTLAPQSLIAEVTDAGGNPLNDVGVKWSVTEGTATLSDVETASGSTGQVSAHVTPTAGPVLVTVALASNSAVNAVFTINVNSVVTALQIVSGNDQQIKESTAFPNPLVVQVNDNGVAVPDATVDFAVSSGSATLSSATASTNTEGQAQVTATAGATAGPVVITASIGSYTQTFNLTVNPSGPTITAITNAAGFQKGSVSPCSLATIFGTGLAEGLQGVASAFIAPQTQVAGVTVSFGGVLAPILDVANVNGQESVSFQVPCETPTSSAATLVVTVDNVASLPFNAPNNVTVSEYSPGIFQFTDTDGALRAVLVRPDGSFASLANPARLGETERMFVTGLGQTKPNLFTNEFDPLIPDATGNLLVPEILPVIANLVVGINNAGVLVASASYAYGMVGVYEVDFEVPANTALTNKAPFAIAVVQTDGQLLFGNGSLIAIQ